MSREAIFWHVTRKTSLDEIIDKGFMGGWGDNGFGVYLYSDRSAALDYIEQGGWDGESLPEDLCLIKVISSEEDVEEIEVHPEWPDPESYEHVVYHPMDDGGVTEHWAPQRVACDFEINQPEL